jgi:hypothetical protein
VIKAAESAATEETTTEGEASTEAVATEEA